MFFGGPPVSGTGRPSSQLHSSECSRRIPSVARATYGGTPRKSLTLLSRSRICKVECWCSQTERIARQNLNMPKLSVIMHICVRVDAPCGWKIISEGWLKSHRWLSTITMCAGFLACRANLRKVGKSPPLCFVLFGFWSTIILSGISWSL